MRLAAMKKVKINKVLSISLLVLLVVILTQVFNIEISIKPNDEVAIAKADLNLRSSKISNIDKRACQSLPIAWEAEQSDPTLRVFYMTYRKGNYYHSKCEQLLFAQKLIEKLEGEGYRLESNQPWGSEGDSYYFRKVGS